MARNGTGTYVPPNNSWNPPVLGTIAGNTDWAAILADLTTALSQSVSNDGQTPMIGNLPMGNNKITGLAPGVALTDAATFGQVSAVQAGTPIVGLTRNLRASLATAGTTVTITADELVLKTALGGTAPFTLSAFSKAINIGSTGAGGMDTGAAPVSGYVAIYAIYNPTTLTSALLGTNATSVLQPEVYGGANMPAGYTFSALVAVWPTNASSQLIVGYQVDRLFGCGARTMLSTVATGGPTTLSVASAVPLNAKTVGGTLNAQYTGAAGTALSTTIAGSSTGIGAKQTYVGGAAGTVNTTISSFDNVPLITPQTVFYTNVAAGGTAPSFTINATSYTI